MVNGFDLCFFLCVVITGDDHIYNLKWISKCTIVSKLNVFINKTKFKKQKKIPMGSVKLENKTNFTAWSVKLKTRHKIHLSMLVNNIQMCKRTRHTSMFVNNIHKIHLFDPINMIDRWKFQDILSLIKIFSSFINISF